MIHSFDKEPKPTQPTRIKLPLAWNDIESFEDDLGKRWVSWDDYVKIYLALTKEYNSQQPQET